jgi:hypothetical protein
MGRSKKAWGITKRKVVIHVNPIRLTNYTTVRAKVVVTHATSYDVLVRGVVLYLLGVTLDFGRKLFIIDQDGR